MIKLQNNFTTPEQSRRLLELGVPADSADCYYAGKREEPTILLYTFTYSRYTKGSGDYYTPCWSVGRLIEIVSICYTGTKFYYSPKSSHKVEFWLERIEKWLKIGFMDFSKMED